MDNSKTSPEAWGVGNRADAPSTSSQVVGGRSVDLITGEHPHTRSSKMTYARFKGRDSGGHIHPFRGHLQRWGLVVEEFNYLKESASTGNEVRRGCKARISLDGIDIYEITGRDMLDLLPSVHTACCKLSGLHFDLNEPKKLSKRAVYYNNHPASVVRLDEDGRLTLRAETPFPKQAWEGDEYEALETIAVDVLSPQIHWYR